MENDFFTKYAELQGGLITDTNDFPLEVKAFLTECQYSIKNGLDFVSNYEEIYNFRPEFIVGFLQSIKKTAFTCANDEGNKCFIGISLGLILSIHNIVCESLRLNSGFLSYYLKNTYHEIGKEHFRSIKPTILNPVDIDSLTQQFCRYKTYPFDKDTKETIYAIVFTAIDFICKHELAHFFRSHSTIPFNGINAGYFDEEYSNLFFASNDGTDINRRLFMRALESDADTQAIIMAMREFDSILTDDYNIDKIDQDVVLDTVFEFGLAIGILFLCLDNRLDLEIQFKGTHPPSIVRFQNAIHILLTYCETMYESNREILHEENINILLELENLAILMGYPEGLWIRFEKPLNDKFLDLDDMIKLWNNDHVLTGEIVQQIDKHARYDFIGMSIT